MTIAEKIYKIRTDMNLSQKEFAEKIGTSQSAINYWENGKRQLRLAQLQKIADVLEIDLVELIGVDGIIDQSKLILNDVKTHPQSWNMTDVHTCKDNRDIKEILSSTEQLLQQEGLMFDGQPASQEAIDSILSAMQIGMEMAKKKNKEKYTPKKYKKEE